LLPIIFGLLAALTWGGGDFSGGLASRRSSALRAITLAELAGLVGLLLFIPIVNEPIPPLDVWIQSGVASLVGTVGLIILFRAFAEGKMSIAAPVSSLLAAVIPVVVSIFTEGLPPLTTYIGFGLAMLSIWLVSQEGGKLHIEGLRDLRMPFLAGLGFGSYFVIINHATQEYALWPLISARLAASVGLVVLGFARRKSLFPSRPVWALAIFSGIMDTGGNAFYILAGQTGRMDVSAVIAALYPAVTVILAWVLLKEHIRKSQWLGVLAALAAIAIMAQ